MMLDVVHKLQVTKHRKQNEPEHKFKKQQQWLCLLCNNFLNMGIQYEVHVS